LLLKKPYKPDQLKTGSVPKYKEMNKKLKRAIIKFFSNLLILIGWNFPLLMIIGVILIGIGSVSFVYFKWTYLVYQMRLN